uniref:Integrase core domain containing protein n=1 Tax=Solanum tuberosum TaxID=4113 RepID=M1DE07_SOLTU
MGVYSTHFTTSNSESEDDAGSRTRIYDSVPADDLTLKQRRDELRFKELYDPARLLALPTPPPPPAQAAEHAPQAGVPFLAKTDVEVTPASSSDFRRIEVEYIKDESKWRRRTPMDTSLTVDLEAMETDTTLPTLAGEPIGFAKWDRW